jgi:hypothetical protein
MVRLEDYVARVDGTCGKEKDVIVIFKYDKREEVVKKILEKAVTKKSIAGIVSELTYRDYSFRLYGSGKAIFRSLRDKDELNALLSELLV